MSLSLNNRVRGLAAVCAGIDATLELRKDGVEYVAMIVPRRGVAIAARDPDAAEALRALHKKIEAMTTRGER